MGLEAKEATAPGIADVPAAGRVATTRGTRRAARAAAPEAVLPTPGIPTGAAPRVQGAGHVREGALEEGGEEVAAGHGAGISSTA